MGFDDLATDSQAKANARIVFVVQTQKRAEDFVLVRFLNPDSVVPNRDGVSVVSLFRADLDPGRLRSTVQETVGNQVFEQFFELGFIDRDLRQILEMHLRAACLELRLHA